MPPIELNRIKELQNEILIEGKRLLDKAINMIDFSSQAVGEIKLTEQTEKKSTKAKEQVVFNEPTKFEITDIDIEDYENIQEFRNYASIKELMTGSASIESQKVNPLINLAMQALYTIDKENPVKFSLPFTFEQFGSEYGKLKKNKSPSIEEKDAIICFDTLFDLSKGMLVHYRKQLDYEEQGIARIFSQSGGEKSSFNKIDAQKEFDMIADHFMELKPFVMQETKEYSEKYNISIIQEAGGIRPAIDQLKDCAKSVFNPTIEDFTTRPREFPEEVTTQKQEEDLDIWINQVLVPFNEKVNKVVKERHMKDFEKFRNLKSIKETRAR